jgi:hypothetical protein
MSEPRRPLHLVVVVGLSAAAYAATLAGVTALQATSDRELVAANAPAADMLALLTAEHDRLEARMADAAAAYDAAASAYTDIGPTLTAMEQRLAKLAAQVKAVEGSAAWTPPPVRLPAVSRNSGSGGGAAAAPKPTPNGGTGGSGH